MRIVFYSHVSQLGNGATESLLAVVSVLSKKHKCAVITPTISTLNYELNRRGVENISLPFKWTSSFDNKLSFSEIKKSGRIIKSWILNYLYHKKHLNKHISYFKQFKPDVIYSNTSVISMGLMVARHLHIPHIWHLREFQTRHLQLLPNFNFWYFSRQLRRSDILIVNSKALQEFYSQYIPNRNIYIVYNGIEVINNDHNPIKEAPFVFLMVGALMKVKGHSDAIVAAKRLVDKGYTFRLDIVGKGEDAKLLNDLIARLDLEKTVFLYGQHLNIERFYNSSNCYLMCSESESFGRVTVEAMMHGLPVIGKVGPYTATGEIVRNQVDGFHFKEINELEEKMEFIITNREKGIEMGQAGKKRALKEFPLTKCVEKIERILMQVAFEKTP